MYVYITVPILLTTQQCCSLSTLECTLMVFIQVRLFGLLKTWYILSSFHSTLQLPGGFKGTKHCGRGQKRLAWTQKHSIFHDRTQSSICQYCDCLVMLCHSLYKKKNWKDFKVNFFLVQEVFSSKKEASTYIHTNFYIAPQHYT